MSVARITTVTARSSEGFEAAIRLGVERASETIRNITGAWVKEHKVTVNDGAISDWQVTLEITFVLE